MLRFPITDDSHVGTARRLAADLADSAGFSEADRGKVSIAVTEAATNLAKHASKGELIIRITTNELGNGLEVLAIDRGPGMLNPAEALRDGYSTSGSSGIGLGGIQRLSDEFDILSIAGRGTVMVARFWLKSPQGKRRESGRTRLDAGCVCLPLEGETKNGDACCVVYGEGLVSILVADGLGHGPLAADSSTKAVRVFEENADATPVEIIEEMHRALTKTRGAAVAVAAVDLRQGEIRYAGVGNIRGTVLRADHKHGLTSHNGTVGHSLRKVQEFVYPFAAGALLVMHSDGLMSRWNVDDYPGIMTKHPSLVAAVLYRDFRRGPDDVTVLAARAAGRI